MNDTVSTGFGLVKQEVHPQLSQIITLNAINLLVNKFGDQHVEDAVNCRVRQTHDRRSRRLPARDNITNPYLNFHWFLWSYTHDGAKERRDASTGRDAQTHRCFVLVRKI